MSALTPKPPSAPPQPALGRSVRTGPAPSRELSLAIGGMTCGACVARVERALNRLEGVTAQVNYASERASVSIRGQLPVQRLLDAVVAAGYTAEPLAANPARLADALERRTKSLRRRLLVTAALFMPLCDASIVFSVYPSLRFTGWQWLMVVLAAPVVSWAAWPFYEAAIRNARHGATTMDTLVSVGILAATGWSLYSMFFVDAGAGGRLLLGLARRSGGGIYLDVPAGVTTFLLAGRYFEAWSRQRSGNALEALAAVAVREVSVLDGAGRERRKAIAELMVGERFVARPGETVATDGEVVRGRSAIDRSVMTGEPQPVEVGPGDSVLGGTVSVSGRIVVVARKVGRDTQLGQMMRLVERAQNEKAAVQRLADRVSRVFVPSVMLISVATLAVWRLSGSGVTAACSAALSVLIIACPCALGLATPAALLVATWSGARLGIFFKSSRALEASRHIDTVVLDKTGTLTEGKMTLVDLDAVDGVEERELLRLAAAIERASEHPIARAVADLGEDWLGGLPAVESFVALPGEGARGYVEGREVYVGRIERGGEALPVALGERCEAWQELGRTVVIVRRDGDVIGGLAVADVLRPSAAAAVQSLTAMGLRCVLLTGDNESTARAVAASVGVTEVVANALPSEKVAIVRRLQGEGRRVAMIGDGINDAPALAAADLGLAVGSGTDIALNAADLIIVRDDLCVAADAIELARRTLSTIRANLAWAFLYNLAAIPVAACGLLDPLLAGAAMALSSSFVVWNSSRLRHIAPAHSRAVAPAETRVAPHPLNCPSAVRVECEL